MWSTFDEQRLKRFVTRHKRAIKSVLLVTLVALFTYPILLDVSYVNRMPSAPDAATGRTHWMSLMHGYEIYVTAEEKRFNELVGYLAFGGFFAVAAAAFWIQRRYFSQDLKREEQLRKGLKLKEEIERSRKS